MQTFTRKLQSSRSLLAALLSLVLFSSATAWQGSSTTPAKAKAAPTLTSEERKASARIKLETIREITAKLSSPEFEGRGTAQPGGDRAAQYLADRFKALGLKPAGENGTYLQPIKFKSAEVLVDSKVAVGDAALNHRSDYVVLPPYTSGEVNITGDIVFIGYGVVSEELKRDDLAGLDLKGKVVVLLNGQPTGVDPDAWRRASNPQARGMNIFSRGAAAMIVGNAGSAAQPFSTIANYLSRRRVSLASVPGPPFRIPPILLASDAAMEKIFAGSEKNYAQILEQTKTGANVSRSLQKQANLALKMKSEEATSSNVV
ncbi:MAG TPA: hypothetical protein VFR80_07570, partial [Pyrinomonadaceae bacterium]|nr:hypothetical protein [Pyrinomonadaceae bacterium]